VGSVADVDDDAGFIEGCVCFDKGWFAADMNE
jgi:hypothetical protein